MNEISLFKKIIIINIACASGIGEEREGFIFVIICVTIMWSSINLFI